MQKWIEQNITENAEFWLKENIEDALFFGAVQPALLAACYQNYQHLAGDVNLNWTHTTKLGELLDYDIGLLYKV
jgi:hypothetical protein